MKALNSKERSKKLWQFVIIFLGLTLVPTALIFFSYYHVPEELSEMEGRKLASYSNFEHAQKRILDKMSEIDSNISLYATAKTENPVLLDKKIADGLTDLASMDTSIKMVKLVSDGYAHHYTHVRQLVDAQSKLNDALAKLQDAESRLKSAQSAGMMGAAPMPLPPAQ
ncbi:MAG: hypothetical protein JST06_01165 [Bacteroidetes bacterium]|nr:hypothetical protein [Bacteroidota bacterium]MBS1629563.1 hypothetical protein [Bacteroidota bacterium]